jgi:hypothetical protein
MFLATKLGMNAMIAYVVVVYFQQHLLLVLIACYWLVYSMVDLLEEEGRINRIELLWGEK